jgi:hypothetical protein
MSWLLASGKAQRGGPVAESPWLQDDFVDCYARWREECTGVRLAYERWRDSEPDVEPLAYAAYLAALDREDHAAADYRDCADRIAGRP